MSLKLIAVIAAVITFGWIAFNNGMLDQEIDKLQENGAIPAANLSPEIEGNALFLQARYSEAMSKYREALKSNDPETRMEAQYRIARCQEELGNEPAARAAYQAFMQKYPNDARARKAQERVELLTQ